MLKRHLITMIAIAALPAAMLLSGCGGGSNKKMTNQPADMPPPMHTVGLAGLHGLADWLTANPGGSVTVPAGGRRDIGGVRFSCPPGGADCGVAVTSADGTIMISSTDGMASAEVINPTYWIVQSADTLLMSDSVARRTPLGDIRVQSDCTGTTCTFRSPFTETTNFSLSDQRAQMVRQGLSPDEPTTVTETYSGVWLNTYEDYDGWMNYSFFLAGRGSALSQTYPVSMSWGVETGSNPVRGSATWSGVMVGVDVSATRYRNRLRGDADLTIADFTNPKLDVAFTDISDADDADRRRADMTWDDVPVTSGGFGTGSDGNSIQGKFYGPNHEEVGGIFERDQVIGAFGAKRR